MYQEFPSAFINTWGSPMELLVVAFAVLMLFGAKSLPNALRTLGKWQYKFGRAWREIQRELTEIEEPFQQARKAWEEEMEEFTVSSAKRPGSGSDGSTPEPQGNQTAAVGSTNPEEPPPAEEIPGEK